MLAEKVNRVFSDAQAAFLGAQSTRELYDLKVRILGKKGELSSLMQEMGRLTQEERPKFGQLVNEKKQALELTYEEREKELKKSELQLRLEGERLDMTLPGPHRECGGVHPTQWISDEIVRIMSKIGYSVRLGPLIEMDYYNFEALNIPAGHPARDEQDTFYVDARHVLRTHTSPVQIHTMEKEPPPIRVIAPGPVFRCDRDVSHSPNFHQIECLMVDRVASLADLKGTISFFVREFFGKDLKTRFRASFFPFTEPSAEVDCSCPLCKGKGCGMCKHTGWIEIGGCGLVNPKVLKFGGIDPSKWQGFAFGFGLERMAIIKFGIEDIRLFSENDLRFLRQFNL